MNYENKKIWIIASIAVLIILFSLSLRIDLNNFYPKGADTYDLYALSKNIQEKQYIVWNIDLLTSLGLTSFSYPAGGIIFLAEMSLITGLNTTIIILIWNFILVLICALLIFLISKELFRNNIIALLLSLIYLNTRFFISYSTFFTARNILHLFFLIVLLLLIKNMNEQTNADTKNKNFKNINLKNIALIILIFVISMFTHRATLLIGIFIFTFIVSKLLYKFYKNKTSYNLAIVTITLAIFIFSAYTFGHTNIGSETSRIPFKIGVAYIDTILSILFSLSMHFGVLILIIPIGYFFLIVRNNKSQKDFFILMTLTIAAGFVVETVYFFYLFLPIITILAGYFFEKIIYSNKTYLKNIAIFFIIIALIAPIYITIRESKSDLTYVRSQTAGMINFLDDQNIQKSIICNNHVTYCSQTSALANNVNALTHASGRTMIDKVNVTESKIIWSRIRSKVLAEDNFLGVSLFSDTYTSAIVNWNTPKPLMDKLVEFTNLGYIVDSNNPDSVRNRPRIEDKFGDMDQIYDNGLQQVKVVE